jgi:hypothetical protein
MMRPAPAIDTFFMNWAISTCLVWGSVSSQNRCIMNAITSTRIARSNPARSIQMPRITAAAPRIMSTPLTCTASLADGTFL